MRTIWMGCCIACLSFVSTPKAQAVVLIGPTPYLAFDNTLPGAGAAISPFSSLVVDDYFYNETFEDGLLNTLGLSTVSGFGGSVIGPGGLTDSVDADDGIINGSGTLGRSYFRAAGNTGFHFQFDSTLPGGLPTHAGLVWTDGQFNTNITFEAFGAANESLGVIVANGFQGGAFTGQTSEDRFLGVIHSGGISSLKIFQPGGGIEVDHVQYGRLSAPNATVPEPTSFGIFGLMGALMLCFRRKWL